MIEDPLKRQFFHRTEAGRKQLLNLGLAPRNVTDTICVLGFYLVGNRSRKSAGKETYTRLTEAMDRTKQARALPGSKDRAPKDRELAWLQKPLGVMPVDIRLRLKSKFCGQQLRRYTNGQNRPARRWSSSSWGTGGTWDFTPRAPHSEC